MNAYPNNLYRKTYFKNQNNINYSVNFVFYICNIACSSFEAIFNFAITDSPNKRFYYMAVWENVYKNDVIPKLKYFNRLHHEQIVVQIRSLKNFANFLNT